MEKMVSGYIIIILQTEIILAVVIQIVITQNMMETKSFVHVMPAIESLL